MRNWKVFAGVAGAAAVLSLLLGIAAANPFGVILLRMLLCGLGAGGVAYGLGLVVERFLPDLGAGASGSAASSPGGRLDIVLPAENPHEAPAGDTGDASSEYPEDETLSEQEGLLGGSEDIGDEREPDRKGADAAAPAEDVEDLGYPEEVPSESEDAGGAAEGQAAVDIMEAEELSASPELDEQIPAVPGTPGGSKTRGASGADALDIAHQNPEDVARAVRTMLKRDQEG